MTLRPGRFQRACFIRDRDGRGRLHTVERSGQKRTSSSPCRRRESRQMPDPRLFMMGSRHPKARHAASQEACCHARPTLGNVKAGPRRVSAIFIKFGGEMTYFRQALPWQLLAPTAVRPLADGGTRARLQPDSARPICGRDRRLDRAVGWHGRSQRQADRHRFFQFLRRRFAGAGRPRRRRLRHRRHYAREQQIFGPATPYYGWLYPPIFLLVAARLALLPYPLALFDLAGRDPWRSIWPSSPPSCAGRGMTAARSPGSGCRSPPPFPPSSSTSGTAKTAFSPRDYWAPRCDVAAAAAAVRHSVRPPRLQAAIRRC